MFSSRTMIGLTALSYLIATNIGFAQVNNEAISLFPQLRLAALIVCATSLILLLIHRGLSASLLMPVIVIVSLYFTGYVRSADVIYLGIGPSQFASDLLVIIVGTIVLALYADKPDHAFVRLGFLVFAIGVASFLVGTGGITLLPFPAFNFDILANERTLAVAQYGQGPSKFFGVMVIFAAWHFIVSARPSRYYLFAPIIIVGVLLSFLSGGRGEFIFLVIVIVTMASLSAPLTRARGLWLTFALVALLGVSLADSLSQTSSFARFYYLWEGKGFSNRDTLFFQSIDLLRNEPLCLFWGCGLGFFQSYYHYVYGLYPHNLILESIIVWGAAIVVPLLAIFVLGISEARRQLGPVFWVGAYLLAIGLKSGDIIGSWAAISFFAFVTSKGAPRLFRKKRFGSRQRMAL